MAQLGSIEIPVSLGLLNALQQIEAFRLMLNKSVKVDSTAFKDISQYLNKMANLAESLKGKMSQAFKTPSGSTHFLQLYELLMSMLELAGDKFTNLGVNDIAFSSADTEKINKYREEIKLLEVEIKNLEKGKVGNIFEGDAVANADKVREVIKELKLSTENLTFSKLSNSINTELGAVEEKITSTSDKLRTLNTQIEAISDNKLTELTASVQSAIDRAVNPKKSTFNSENLSKYTEALSRFYSKFENYTGKTNFKTTGNVETFLTNESNAIALWAEKTKSLIKNAELVLLLLEELRALALSKGKDYDPGQAERDQVSKLLLSLGLDIDPSKIDTSNYVEYVGKVKEAIISALRELFGVASSEEADLLRDSMLAELKKVFDGLDFNKTIDATQLKASLNNIFKNAKIDDSAIKEITSGLSDKMSPEAAFKSISELLDGYINRIKEKAGTTQEELTKLLEASERLRLASGAVGNVEGNIDASIEEKRAKLQGLIGDINTLVEAYNKLNGTNLHINISGMEAGKSQIESYILSLTKLLLKLKALSNVQMAVNRWMGFWQVLNMTKKAVNDMKQHIQELDTVMTSISVVTNFSQEDLWGQVRLYSEIARLYGVAIKGVYEVSLIYYQQGLLQSEVMTLTTETLKMARIAGLDYATAADYMTTAIRGFKLEMTDAAHVTDVFSALAATTASSTEEIAVAISKTAASALAVGASFEATSAMMATMIATTRESATNIGTALKSVISRYGEMTSDPSKTVDSEGEEMSLNRVDKALLTVGITIHDTAGLFRDFDDVMLELMEKWDSLDSLSQRYIATLMAGNRQQSRFLALVSNVDEYKKALQTAMDSEGTGELLTLKTLDSIDAKIEKMKVTIQEFYTSSGIEEFYKNIIDTITNIISAANSLPKTLNKFPAQALSVGMSLVTTIKSVMTLIIAEILLGLEKAKGNNTNFLIGLAQQYTLKGQEAGKNFSDGVNKGLNGFLHSKRFVLIASIIGSAAQLLGSGIFTKGLSLYGASTSSKEDNIAINLMKTGAIISAIGGIGSGAAMGFATAGPWGALAGGVSSLVTLIPTLITAFTTNTETLSRQLEINKKAEEKAKEELSRNKGEEKSLELALNLLNKLKEALYESAEAAKEYTDYMNLLGDLYPNLISSINLAGNSIIEITDLENELAKARQNTAVSTVDALTKELDRIKTEQGIYNELWSDFSQKNLIGSNKADLVSTARNIAKTKYRDARGASYSDEEILFTEFINRTGGRIGKKNYKPTDDTIFTLAMVGNHTRLRDYINKLYAEDENFESIMIDALNNIPELLQKNNNTQLKQWIKTNIQKYLNTPINDTLILGYLNLTSVSDIDSLDTKLLFSLAELIEEYASLLYVSALTTLNSVSEALFDALITKDILTKLNKMTTGGNEEAKNRARILLNYTKLMSFIYSGMGGLPDDNLIKQLEDWIISFPKEADALLSLDYASYRNTGELNLGSLPPEFLLAFENLFTKIRSEAVNLYTNYLDLIFKDDKPLTLLNSALFSNKTLSSILSNLTKYSSMLLKGNLAGAEAYLNNIINIYKEIGTLGGPDQDKAYSIIKDLDLSDPAALRSAAESFTDMGGKFADMAPVFSDAALRWTTNAATLIEQLSSSTQETVKSIESSTADMSKVFKYSEALEKALTLIDANKDLGLEFDLLYTFDKDVGGYIKTAKAFNLEMASFLNTQVEGVLQSITDLTETLLSPIKNIDIRDWLIGSLNMLVPEEARQLLEKNAKDAFASLTNTNIGDVNFDRLWQEYTQIVEAFNNREDQSIEWDEFVEDYVKKNGEQLKTRLEQIQEMPLEMARQALSTFDYTSIVSGKGTALNKEELKALLMASASDKKIRGRTPSPKDLIDEKFDTEIYPLLIQGKIEEYNSKLDALGLGAYKASESEANRVRFESLTSLYDKIASGDVVWDALTEQELELLNSIEGVDLKAGASAAQVGAAADNVWLAIIALIAAGAGTLNEVADTIANKADKNFKESNAGKLYNLLTSYKDGFTSNEAQELGLLDNEGNLKEEFTRYLERDSAGNWVAKAGLDAASVIKALANILNISINTTTDEYKNTIKESVDEAIATADKADIGKLRVNAWQSVMSGKAGDRINLAGVDDTTKGYMKAAGLIDDISSQFVYIESEKSLNEAIKWMREWLSDDNNKQHNPLTARYFLSMVSEWEAKIAKNTAFEGITGEAISQSAAEALSMALNNSKEFNDVQTLMTSMGFKWNDAALTWKATAESIKAAKDKIQAAWKAEEIDSETYYNLIAALNNTALAINPEQLRRNAVQDVVENYENLSEESIAAFSTAFDSWGINIRDYITTDEWGKNRVNLAALNEKLATVGYDVNELFLQEIAAIGDSYLLNISTGVSLLSSGTNNLADIGAFVESYNETMGTNLLAKNVSYYDDILKAFTIRPEFIKAYIEKLAENLKALGIIPEEKVDLWVLDNTAEFARENIDIGSFLSSERTLDDVNKIGRALQTYYELIGVPFDLLDTEVNVALEALLGGGRKAVAFAKTIKPNLTESELAEIYSNAINRWNDALGQVENLVQGLIVTGELKQILSSLNLVTPDGVVKHIDDMVNVYAAIYDKMKSTAGATTADLNNAYAKLLNARDLKNVDTMDALENAANMSFDALALLFNNLNRNLEAELPNLLRDNVVGFNGFGGIRVFDFASFAKRLGLAENSPEYYEAYSKYADSMADFYNSTNNIIDNVAEQIKGLVDAKPGKAINVSYLQQTLGDKFTNAIEQYVGKHADLLLQGIMVLDEGVDIALVITEVANVAAKAGLILPELLAELADAVAEVLSQMTSLITGGISGNLKNTDAFKLLDWATLHGLGKLDFTLTADGLKLSNDSAKLLYNTMNNLDSIQGQIVFKALKESLIESDDSFKSISTSAARTAEMLREFAVKATKEAGYSKYGNFFASMNGNVDLYNRPILNNEDGSYSTLLTTTLDSRNYETDIPWIMNVTPITKDGKKLDDGALGEYIQKLIDGTDGSLEAILEADAKDLGLIIELADAAGKDLDALANSLDNRAEILHEISAIYEAIKKGETFDDTKIKLYQEELNLLHEILAERATTEDASFKFMENAIPSGQNNPLNYFENWGKAWKTLLTGVKEGSMAYQDWYNIITEMNNIAGVSGQTIEMAGVLLDGSMEAAAKAILAGAKALTVTADGSIKVDLSNFGIDLAAGANSLQEGVDKGIDAIADSLIKMLDSMILLLETIVAMEQLGDIDVEGDGIDFSNLFEMTFNENTGEWETNFEKFSKGYEAYRDYVLKRIDEKNYPKLFNKDLAEGINKTKLKVGDQEFVFGDLLKMEPSELAKHAEDGLGDAYAAVLLAYKIAAASGDYDENHIMESIKTVLSGTGFLGEIDIGDLHLTFKLGYVLERDSEGKYIVEGKKFDNEGKAINAMAASQLEGLLGSAKDIDTKTGTVTYHGAIDTTVIVDVENNKYSASFSNGGGSVSSTTLAGLAAAIETYTLLNPEDFAQKEGGANAANGEVKSSFTITLKNGITANVEAEVVEGEWKITNVTGKDGEELDSEHRSQIETMAQLAFTKTLDVSGQIKANVLAGAESPVGQDIKTGENETGEAVKENEQAGADSPVNQDIKNEINETKLALLDNITLGIRGVYLSIRLGSDSVRERILANAALAKRTPVILSVVRRGTTDTVEASGTVGLAKSKGTLMGELGPELVVSKGHYFVVGLNGPEMVDLADDAIVFNHLQTQSLLTKGMSRERGRAVTNERNAVSFATGNINGGPAMASASAALAALKQLRDMWEALKSASVSDLAGAGGGGGGGGGGDKIVDPKAWVKTVERWYNLTQEIARLEKDITHEETLRSKLQSDFNKNGTHYYNSLRLSLKALRELVAAQEQLNLSRQSYYTRRIDALKNEPLGKLYTFDENGLMHFRNDVNINGLLGAMNFLTDFMGFDKNGKANYTNELKYNILKQYGFDEYMKYNSNGEQILLDADHSGDVTDEEKETYYQQATEAWRDRMDNFALETQSLWDSIKEGENNLLELQTSQNELLLEMRDNQIEVEEEVLKAVEDLRQREIDALQDERDKLEDSTGKFIQGLSDALSREQEMYNDLQSENDLNQQRRRLAILLRSGGSAADIANLQLEINNNERSRYFDLLQKLIDAIQEASDLLLERMDDLIKLMTETLEYQKEYGLLWGNVYEVMNGSAAQITSFITHGNSEFWSKSPLSTATAVNDILFKAELWKGFREDMTNVASDVSALAFPTRELMKANDYKIFNEAMIKEFGADYDKNGTYKELFEKIYDETGDLTKANTAATDLTRAKYEEEAAKKLIDTINTNTAPVATTPATSSPSNDSNKCKGCAGECTKGCAYSCVGKCGTTCEKECSKGCTTGCKETCKTKCVNECYASCLGGCKGSSSFSALTYTASLPKKASGGFVKHGIYELGEEGTEGVLNARLTHILRENILSNKPNSLITLLNTYNEAYKDGITSVPGQSGESFIIENATVNMNVQQIANDYDARRAGEQALNEMMRIARKTSAANSIRR